MPRKICARHGKNYPCSCGMGNLYRFIEPVVLHLLQIKGRSCGYNLCSDLQTHALTDAEIDKAALYRTLRQLEANGNVKSAWETGDGGPARRVYRLTRKGEEHLEEWAVVLEHLAKSMDRFVRDARRSPKKPASARACAA
jgi:PadR family transcriptional regulator PadR